MNRSKYWFPIKGLALFFIVSVASFYFLLISFDPGTPRNPAEWEPKKPDPKKTFWMRVIEKQLKKK